MVKRDRAPQGVKPVKSEDGNDEPEEESQSFLRKYVRVAWGLLSAILSADIVIAHA